MANKFEAYEKFVKSFNDKYKVNFSFEKYEKQSLKSKSTATALVGKNDIVKENLAYRNALLNVYKECVENMMNNKYKTFAPGQLAKDFEKLMGNYRSYCEEKGKAAPDLNGGWKNTKETVDDMRSTLNAMEPNKVEYTKEKYLSGQLRLRDIKRDVQDMVRRGEHAILSVEDLATAMVYGDVLNSAKEERTLLWKLNPFNWAKMRAENRFSKAIGELLNINMENVITAGDLVEENVVAKAQADLDKVAKTVEIAPEEKKVQLNMDFLSEKANAKEASQKVEEKSALSKDHSLQA